MLGRRLGKVQREHRKPLGTYEMLCMSMCVLSSVGCTISSPQVYLSYLLRLMYPETAAH